MSVNVKYFFHDLFFGFFSNRQMCHVRQHTRVRRRDRSRSRMRRSGESRSSAAGPPIRRRERLAPRGARAGRRTRDGLATAERKSPAQAVSAIMRNS